MKTTIPIVIKGSKNWDQAQTYFFYQKCSLPPLTGIEPIVGQICLFTGNSCLIMILYILLTSKSNIHRKLPFNKHNLWPDFQFWKMIKNKRSRPKRAIFRYFSTFSQFSLVPTYGMLYTARSEILRGIWFCWPFIH